MTHLKQVKILRSQVFIILLFILPFNTLSFSQSHTLTTITTTTHQISSSSITLLLKKDVFDEKWHAKYNQLAHFYSQYGHTLVPQRYEPNPSLGIWVRNQRLEYGKLVRGSGGLDKSNGNPKNNNKSKKSRLTPDRVAKLDALNFVWDAKDHAWQHHYQLLRTFWERNGHCHVSAHDETLGAWVRNQRALYTKNDGHRRVGGGTTKRMALTPRRVALLDDLGFCWSVADRAWEKRYETLKKFRWENGHCRVPSRYDEDPSLGRWVLAQRMKYKKYVETNSSKIIFPNAKTRRRIEKLDELDFVWDPNDHYWWEQYSSLKRFWKDNGHCVVPLHYDDDPKLGIWVSNQRRRLKEFAWNADGAGGFNEERIRALRDIGFESILLEKAHDSCRQEVTELSLT